MEVRSKCYIREKTLIITFFFFFFEKFIVMFICFSHWEYINSIN